MIPAIKFKDGAIVFEDTEDKIAFGQCSCLECTNNPIGFVVDIEGVTDRAAPNNFCTDCEDLNGTYVCTDYSQGDAPPGSYWWCKWSYEKVVGNCSPPSGQTFIRLTVEVIHNPTTGAFEIVVVWENSYPVLYGVSWLYTCSGKPDCTTFDHLEIPQYTNSGCENAGAACHCYLTSLP